MALCEKCWTKLEDGVEVCPKCGAPVSNEEKEPPRFEKSPKNIIISIIAILILAAVIFAAERLLPAIIL